MMGQLTQYPEYVHHGGKVDLASVGIVRVDSAMVKAKALAKLLCSREMNTLAQQLLQGGCMPPRRTPAAPCVT